MSQPILENLGLIVTAVVSLAGVVTGFIALHSQRKKNKAEATESIADAAKTLIEPLRQRIEQLEVENRELRGKIDCTEVKIQYLKERLRDFEAGTERLIFQLKALSVEPVWIPKQEEAKHIAAT